MKLLIFSVLDVKAVVFGTPMFLNNKGVAVRGFADACEDQQSIIFKHPEDYMLYQLGEFDNVSGVITPLAKPEFVSHATEFVKSGAEKGKK